MGEPKTSSDSGYCDPSCSLQRDDLTELCRSHKRKSFCIDNSSRNVSEVMDCSSPQFSSTLNESLMNHLCKVHLEEDRTVLDTNKLSIEQYKPVKDKIFSVPNTPEHLINYANNSTHKTNSSSLVKNFSQWGMQSRSPVNKEAYYNILYPELPCLEYIKKRGTPTKVDKAATQAKKRLFYQKQSPLFQVLSNSLIMKNILKQLSNGDLYRLAKVSRRFKDAILNDFESCSRYSDFTKLYPHHKENYKITPPNSPEKDNEINVEPSPESKNFAHFVQIGKILNKNQSLIKCPQCQKACIVENDIGQCQDINRCGYIFCKKCDSFSINPKDFRDKCNSARLLTKSRFRFGDLSNSATSDYVSGDSSSFFTSSLNLHNISKCDSSDMFMECEVSTPKQNVKRNLSKTFMLPPEVTIFSSNKIATPKTKKHSHRASLVPVVPIETPKATRSEPRDPTSSPQRVEYSICSQQSKRNLKRLTR